MDVAEIINNRTSLTLALLAGCGLSLLLLRSQLRRRKTGLPLPPGPPGLPLLQNVFDIPTERLWLAAMEWAKKYGDLIHLKALGQHIIFSTSYETTIDLMEKRSALYSDRAHSPMMELMGVQNSPGLMAYGDDWRFTRRVFHQELNPTVAMRFSALQRKYALNVVAIIHRDADSFEKHLEYFSSGVILEAIYGFKIQSVNDPYVKIAQEGAEAFAKGLAPGAFLVEVLPFLKWIPSWFPGAQFKRDAFKWAESWKNTYRGPFEEVSKAVGEGTANPSFTASWLSRIDSSSGKYGETERALKLVSLTAAVAHLAGHETTLSAILNFVLHMVQHPEVQVKAQEELDRVIGRSRLPDFEDRESLPYLDAIYKETLRLHPVAPLGLPHRAIADDDYKGMRIPKGSIIFPNVWAMSRDEKEYGPDPSEFRPERFSDPNVRDPNLHVFGFGRRICPGRYLASNSIFILMSYMLQVFSIGRALNEDGSEKPLDPEWTQGLTTCLKPFPASFKLRFEGAERLIQVSE